MLRMDLEYKKKILFVRFEGKLNQSTSYKVNNYLVPVILKHKIKYLVYNITGLTHLDEEGIKAIINTKLAVEKNNGFIGICSNDKSLTKKLSKLQIKIYLNENDVFDLIEA